MEKYKKYYDLIKAQSYIFDKTQNCKIGQTWEYHLYPVIRNAIMLAIDYGANKDVVEVAAIFHDYADLIDMNNRNEHHILGANLAREILIKDGFDKDFIDKVCLCIKNHRASVQLEKNSIEEICVADADALSHLENVVELICWRAYLGEDIKTANQFVKNKIIKSYNKMSKLSQNKFADKYNAILKVLY